VNIGSQPWREQVPLITDLTIASTHISAYVFAVLEADTDDYPSITTREYSLGEYLIDLGNKLQNHVIQHTRTKERIPGEHSTEETAWDRSRRTPTALWANPTTAIYMP
jgi:hypothetical protein